MPTVRLFKVGADPEFGFLDHDGTLVHADQVMTRIRSKFGLDGCASIAEMRPNPSINPSQVVQNLAKDLLEGYYANPGTRNLYWKAGSIVTDGDEDFPTGGHIHLGIHNAINQRVYGERYIYYRKLITYLDTYLAQTVRLLESPDELDDRMGGDYGQLGDHRQNNHGVEYRVLGSWLTSPRVAEGVLCLAQTIAYQHMWMTAHKKKVDLGRLTPGKPIDCGCYDEGDSGYGTCDCLPEYDERSNNIHTLLKNYRKKFPNLRDDIRQFRLYRQHEVPIEFLFKLIEKNKTWYPGDKVDMKIAWGITSVPTLGDKAVSLQKTLPPVRFEDIWKRARN